MKASIFVVVKCSLWRKVVTAAGYCTPQPTCVKFVSHITPQKRVIISFIVLRTKGPKFPYPSYIYHKVQIPLLNAM